MHHSRSLLRFSFHHVLFACLAMLAFAPARAQFVGDFAGAWNFIGGGSPSELIWHGTDSFTIVGSDDPTLGELEEGSYSRLLLSLPTDYYVSFDWSFASNDAPGYEHGGYAGDTGEEFRFAFSNGDSGHESDVLFRSGTENSGFFVFSVDNLFGNASLTISNLTFSLEGGGGGDPDPTEPASGSLLWNGAASSSFTAAGNWGDFDTSDPSSTAPTAELSAYISSASTPITITNEIAEAYALAIDDSTLEVSDASTLTVGGNFLINNSTVTVTDSALVTGTHTPDFNGPAMIIDNGGTLTLDNSTWTHGTFVNVGDYGAGTLELRNGSTATVGNLWTALDAASSATVTLDGAGTVLTSLGADGEDLIGYYGASTMTISNGAVYNAKGIILGYSTKDTPSSLTITGAGSQLNVTEQISVGNFGKGTILVENGATVTTGNVAVAFGALDGPGEGGGEATVTGAGTTWTINGDNDDYSALGIGAYIDGSDYSNGTMTIADGATVTVNGESGLGVVELDRTGTLNIGAGALAGTLIADRIENSGALVFNHTDDVAFNVRINDTYWYSDVGTLTKTGSGTLTLLRRGDFSGETIINEGRIVLDNARALSRSTLNYDNQGGTIEFSDNNDIELGGLKGGQNLALVNNEGEGVTLNVGYNNQDTTYSGVLSGAEGQLGKYGTGTLTLTGANTQGYGVYIDQGTVALAGTGTLGGGGVQIMPDGTLDLGGKTVSIGTVYLYGGTIQNGSFSTTNFSPNAGTINAVMTGSDGIDKYTSGTLVLGGQNTYTGVTNVEEGTLQVNGSIASSSVTIVHTDGRLSGTGTVGALEVQAGGTLAPGNSPGTLHAGSTTWAAGSAYEWEVADADPITGDYDLLSISIGTLDLSALTADSFEILLITLDGVAPGLALNFDAGVDSAYTIAHAGGGIIGFDADNFVITTTGFLNQTYGGTWFLSLANDDKDLRLNFTAAAIPEPSTYAALFGALVLGLAAYRKRRAKVA